MNVEIIWQEYQSSLRRFLLSKVSNQDDVDDLLQTILLKVHEALPSLKQHSSLKAWLFQLSNRTIIDFYRTKNTNTNISADDLWFEDNKQIENEMLKCVEPFIHELPDKYANLLQKVEIEGKSQKSYAEQHNMSYSTLKSQVQKGRSELKKVFEQCCEIEFDAGGRAMGFGEPKRKPMKKC